MASEMMRPQTGQRSNVLAVQTAPASMLGMRQTTKLATGAVISSPAMEQLKRTAGPDLSMHSTLALWLELGWLGSRIKPSEHQSILRSHAVCLTSTVLGQVVCLTCAFTRSCDEMRLQSNERRSTAGGRCCGADINSGVLL